MDHSQKQLEPGPRRDAQQLDELRRQLQEQYVSVSDMAVWLASGVLVMTVLLLFAYLARDLFSAGTEAPDAPRVVIQKEKTLLWFGAYAPGGYALMRLPADSVEVATFRDAALSKALGRKVRSYWLSLYAFGKGTPSFSLDLARQKLVARVDGQSLESLSPSEIAVLPEQLRLQIAPLMTPLTVESGRKARCLVLFPQHDTEKLERVILPRDVRLQRARRPVQSLEGFLTNPKRGFFESSHIKPK